MDLSLINSEFVGRIKIELDEGADFHIINQNCIAFFQGIGGISYRGTSLFINTTAAEDDIEDTSYWFKSEKYYPLYPALERQIKGYKSKKGDVIIKVEYFNTISVHFEIDLDELENDYSNKFGRVHPDHLEILQNSPQDLMILNCGIIIDQRKPLKLLDSEF